SQPPPPGTKLPVPGSSRGAIKRAVRQPVGGSFLPSHRAIIENMFCIQQASELGTKRRAVLQPVGASPKRTKLPQLCPTTEPTSPGPVAARGNGFLSNGSPLPNSMTARAPVLADKIIEAPSCNRNNLQPRKKLSAVDFSKSKGDKDHLSKSKSGVRKELLAREGDLSGSLESAKAEKIDLLEICEEISIKIDSSRNVVEIKKLILGTEKLDNYESTKKDLPKKIFFQHVGTIPTQVGTIPTQVGTILASSLKRIAEISSKT
ncbi:hypothetical protein TNCT_331441, partial [Trichonephila clavata]